MWFKNLTLYQFSEPTRYSAEELEKQLLNKLFSPCGKLSQQSSGWIPPLGDIETAPLVHSVNDALLICLKQSQKIIPPAVVREQLEAQLKEFESKQGRKAGRKDKLRLQDEIFFTLLPQAFVQSQQLLAYIDQKLGLLIINTPSQTQAENFCSILRETLSTLPIEVIDSSKLKLSITQWLVENQAPESFAIRDAAVLEINNAENGKVRYQRHDLFANDVKTLLSQGATVSELAMNWRGDIDFVLQNNYTIKQIKWLDIIKEQINELDKDDLAQLQDATFAIQSGLLRELIEKLIHI